jgi:hypothetical protein
MVRAGIVISTASHPKKERTIARTANTRSANIVSTKKTSQPNDCFK